MSQRELDVCRTCGKPKSDEAFGTYVAHAGPDAGKRKFVSRCRECIAKSKRERYAANPAKYIAEATADYRRRLAANPDLTWERSLRKYHNMSRAEYDAILAEQGGVCAACQAPPSSQRLQVDHCHRSGKRRGLLCGYCNRALAQVDDSIERLRLLIAYLERIN
jgi:Recombination endonuclease VII